jgi:hypothetical protein
VADQLDPEIPPGSPEYIWVSSIISAVEKRTGTSSRWNGRLYEEPNPAYLASAHHDGSMTVSPKNVLEPVRDAYTGRPMKANDYIRVRDAVLTVTHEAAHLTSHLGDPTGPGAHPVGDPADRALEEGLAESWTHRNVDAVIYDIGMDRSVPGVIGPPNVDAYKAYSAATNSLAQGLGTVAGVPPDEVRRQLHGADRAQRWNKVADLMIDRRLGGLMPPEHRDVVRQNLVQPLRSEFHQATYRAAGRRARRSGQGSGGSPDRPGRGQRAEHCPEPRRDPLPLVVPTASSHRRSAADSPGRPAATEPAVRRTTGRVPAGRRSTAGRVATSRTSTSCASSWAPRSPPPRSSPGRQQHRRRPFRRLRGQTGTGRSTVSLSTERCYQPGKRSRYIPPAGRTDPVMNNLSGPAYRP